jgi:integrase
MARLQKRLGTRVSSATLATTGRHSDGGGLYLSVGPGEARRWVFLFRWRGRLREMGLGSFNDVSLARAREKAREAREQIADGINPLDAKRALQAIPTFGTFADDFIQAKQGEWRNEKHREQWSSTLETYAATLRALRIDRVETADVLAALKPIWAEKPETASRVRGRIERVLDAARAQGFRAGENPARWRGHLSHLLPRQQKLSRGHHAALPYADVPAFIGRLRDRGGVAALALEFAILTAARSGEVRGAVWGEFDRERKVWTIPAERMKAKREHRVPLSGRAVDILESLLSPNGAEPTDLVFAAPSGKALSDAAFNALLMRMGVERGTVTPHGFRSSFRDWAGEASTFPREVAELALAHTVGDETERAYRRGDALEKRRKLMLAWGAFCEAGSRSSVVVQLRGRPS